MKQKIDFINSKKSFNNSILNNFIEIKFLKKNGFRLVRETLNRIVTKHQNRYVQECYLYYKRNKYYIVHWAEMKALDSNDFSNITQDALILRNKVANLLVKYDLVQIINPESIDLWFVRDDNYADSIIIDSNKYVKFKVLSFEDRKNYNIINMEW